MERWITPNSKTMLLHCLNFKDNRSLLHLRKSLSSTLSTFLPFLSSTWEILKPKWLESSWKWIKPFLSRLPYLLEKLYRFCLKWLISKDFWINYNYEIYCFLFNFLQKIAAQTFYSFYWIVHKNDNISVDPPKLWISFILK